MPVYSDVNLAGKNAQAAMDVMNTTNSAKDVTLITAYYNADTSLNSILNVYKTSVPGNSTATQRIESPEFAVPASLNGGDIKVFAWDSTSSLIPYLEKTDSEYVAYPQKVGADDTALKAESNAIVGTNLAGSQNWKYEDNFGSSAGNAASAFTSEITTATARSGMSSLCIPTDNAGSATFVYTTVPVKPDTTYRLEFYVLLHTSADSAFAFNVGGACGNAPNLSTYNMPGTIVSNMNLAGNTLSSSSGGTAVAGTSTETGLVPKAYNLNNGPIRFRSFLTGTPLGWQKVTYTFTTPSADTKAYDGIWSKSGTLGEEGSYWTTFGSNISIVFSQGTNGAKTASYLKWKESATWIDDVVLYEVTE